VGAASSGAKANGSSAPTAMPDDAIVVYTDGACSGNPGPCGIGVVIMAGGHREELSEYLGTGTNNIAELTAIERALEEIPAGDRARPIYVHSDSSYSIGLLTKNWKAKANQALVARLRALAKEFANLHLVKVKGHSGVPENERADELAREAVERRD
jgi:ribonuclease HI